MDSLRGAAEGPVRFSADNYPPSLVIDSPQLPGIEPVHLQTDPEVLAIVNGRAPVIFAGLQTPCPNPFQVARQLDGHGGVKQRAA